MAGLGHLNVGYAIGTKGLLKIIVIITTCVAFVVYLSKYNHGWNRGDFFVSVHIAGFVIALVIFLVFFITLENTLGSARQWNILNVIASSVLGVLCIFSSGLLVQYAINDHLKASIGLGCISSVLFLMDALIHFKELH